MSLKYLCRFAIVAIMPFSPQILHLNTFLLLSEWLIKTVGQAKRSLRTTALKQQIV